MARSIAKGVEQDNHTAAEFPLPAIRVEHLEDQIYKPGIASDGETYFPLVALYQRTKPQFRLLWALWCPAQGTPDRDIAHQLATADLDLALLQAAKRRRSPSFLREYLELEGYEPVPERYRVSAFVGPEGFTSADDPLLMRPDRL